MGFSWQSTLDTPLEGFTEEQGKFMPTGISTTLANLNEYKAEHL